MSSEIEERIGYYGLRSEEGSLRSVGRKIDRSLDGALSLFYDKIRTVPELAGMFTGGDHMSKAKSLQKLHWQKLFAEGLNDAYLERALRIGNTHARIGLKPKWYIGGYATIMEQTIRAVIAPGILGWLPWKRRQARQVALLVKAGLFDMDIALSTYFDKTEQDIRDVVDQLSGALSQLAKGDLTVRMPQLPREFAQAEQDFNAAVQSLQQTMSAVVGGIQSISTASSEIRAATDDLALRNEQQAASLEETAAAMNQVTGNVRQSATRTAEIQSTIAAAHAEASDGGTVVSRAISAMDEIESGALEITKIINVIDGIAFQTNLLALNAGVEAARAGDAGKGFAVVANEVRALAQRSADAAKDIKELITASTQQVAGGVKLVGETGELLSKIVVRVGEINEQVTEIASSTEGQAANLQQVNGAVSEMDRMTQQNAAMVEQSTAAARSLADDAGNLAELVGQFRTGQDQKALTAHTPRPAPAAAPRRHRQLCTAILP
ncbi:methyl-accepting chemotaxis protein [Novosphingobium sp. MW5]|nr:methyl-accepting chemotaxis protein [Novosphingobium sp. MW5]